MDPAIDHILKAIREALSADLEAQTTALVKDIREAKKIFVYGVGRSGLIGRSFVIRLVQLNLHTYFIGETVTPIVAPGDLVICVSKTGETSSAVQTANISRRVGAKVVVITAEPHSKLSHASNSAILLTPPHDPAKVSFAPLGTLFEDTALIYFDGIIARLMKEMGETEASLRARHAILV